MADVKWHETYSNVVELADWLDTTCYYFPNTSTVVNFFTKPWNWKREWDIYQLWSSIPENATARERCLEAIDENATTAETIRAEIDEATSNG